MQLYFLSSLHLNFIRCHLWAWFKALWTQWEWPWLPNSVVSPLRNRPLSPAGGNTKSECQLPPPARYKVGQQLAPVAQAHVRTWSTRAFGRFLVWHVGFAVLFSLNIALNYPSCVYKINDSLRQVSFRYKLSIVTVMHPKGAALIKWLPWFSLDEHLIAEELFAIDLHKHRQRHPRSLFSCEEKMVFLSICPLF